MAASRPNHGAYGAQTRRNLFLPDDLVADLKKIAEARGVSYSELIRQTLVRYVKQHAAV